jgi:cytochrome c
MKRVAVLALFTLIACNRSVENAQSIRNAAPAGPAVPGNAQRGRELVNQYGCNVCHTVPGVEGPQGSLAPSLAGIGSRPTITLAAVPNSPETMAKFIQNPTSVNPQSSMPPIAVAGNDVQDIVAYLQTLK